MRNINVKIAIVRKNSDSQHEGFESTKTGTILKRLQDSMEEKTLHEKQRLFLV